MSSPLLSTLGIVCPACDRLNPARSRKCGACGVAFFSTSAPGSAAQAAAPAATAPPSSPARSPASPRQSAPATQAHGRPQAPVLARHGGTAPPTLGAARREPPGPAAVGQATGASERREKRAGSPPETAPVAGPVSFVLTVVAGSAKGERYPIPSSGSWVGRQRGNILFPEDAFVSGHHAALTVHEGRLRVRDEGTASGVFVSIAGQETIPHGALFSVGRRLLRYLAHLQPAVAATSGDVRAYGAPVPPGRPPYGVEEVLVGGRTGRAAIGAGPSLTIGQANCDLCFPRDDSVAARHCQVAPAAEGAVLRDLSGAMGTFVRISPGTDRVLSPGDRLRIGQQILQVEAA